MKFPTGSKVRERLGATGSVTALIVNLFIGLSVGGDVASADPTGIMHGFAKP